MKHLLRIVLFAGLVGVWGSRSMAGPADDNDPGSDIFDMKKPGSKATTKPVAEPPVVPPEHPAPDAPVTPDTTSTAPGRLAQVPRRSSTTPERSPVPSSIELGKSTALVREVYQKELDGVARAPDRKIELGEKLIRAGIDEKTDHAGQYVLLGMAKDLATETADLRLAWRAVDEIGSRYAVDTAKLKTEAAATVASLPVAESDRRFVSLQVSGLASEMMTADRPELVTQLDEIAKTIAAPARESTLTDQLRDTTADHAAWKAAKLEADGARAVLKQSKINASATLLLGKYTCLFLGDWSQGLPYLAASSDAQFKSAAVAELAAPTTSTGKVELGEQWYQLALPQTGVARQHLLEHAAAIYTTADPELSGLAKLKVDKRLIQLAKEIALVAKPVPCESIDLLRQFDDSRQITAGTGKLESYGALSCGDPERTSVNFRYGPPMEYDYRIVFTRTKGNEMLGSVCVGGVASRQFLFCLNGWGSTVSGFGLVEGQFPDHNATTLHGRRFENDQRHTLVIRVRSNNVQAVLDDKPLGREYKTEFKDVALASGDRLSRSDTLGLQMLHSDYLIHSAYVVEVTGHGHFVADGESNESPVVAEVAYHSPKSNVTSYELMLRVDGTLTTSTNGIGAWYLRGDTLTFALEGNALDVCRLASNRRSFAGQTRKGKPVHGEIIKGAI